VPKKPEFSGFLQNRSRPIVHSTVPGDQPHARHLRVAAGIAVSLALHALLLASWRNNMVRLPSEREPPRVLAVLVRPPPPVAVTVPPIPPQPAAPRPHARTRKPAHIEAAPTHAREPAPASTPPGPAPMPEPAVPADQRAAAPATPRFDADAARRFARRIADDPDPAKVGTALAQFPDESYDPHTRIERAIGAAKRRDCKDGIPGGLLAPLFLMLDKKDSGCKW
jgi:hypothetical protein